MALIDCNDAVFDRQANQILEMLEQGMNKNDIAKALGYSNPLSIDNYMRRRNFSWDSREKNFVPAAERYSAAAKNNVVPLRGTSKVDLIISLFDQGDLNVKDIAKQLGFETNKELSKFMKSKGYLWDPIERNYVVGLTSDVAIEPSTTPTTSPSPNAAMNELLKNLLPLLNGVNLNNQVLDKEQIENYQSSNLPRYTIAGRYTTKGMRMAIAMDDLIRKYCLDRNLSQREILEVALIEFFRKYGYRTEVDRIILD